MTALMTALMTPELAAKIARITKWDRDRLAEREAKIVSNEAAMAKLKDAGIPFRELAWGEVVLDSEKLDERKNLLIGAYKVLGQLKEDGEREVIDTRRHIVKLTYRPVAYPGVFISVHYKLDKSAKCKIVKTRTEKEKVRTVHKVVCSR